MVMAACGTEQPEQFVEDGKILMENGDYDTARVQFRTALQIDPKFAEAYFGLAVIDEQKQDWGHMLGNLREAVALDPKHLAAQIKLGQIYLSGGQLEKAKEQAQIALQLSPENTAALLLESAIRIRQGKHQDAMQSIDHVLVEQPLLADALALKANVLLAERHDDEAFAVLRLATAHHPEDRGLRLLKIRLEKDLGQFSAAVADYKSLISLYPADMSLLFDSVAQFNSMGQPDEAEGILRAAIEANPDANELKLQLVDQIALRDPDQVEDVLKNYIADQPPSAGAFELRLASYYLAEKRLEDAKKTLRQIVQKSADLKEQEAARIKLAEIALLQKDYESVDRLAQEVLRNDANQSDALLLRAGMRINRLDTDGAISDLRIVLRDRPDFEQAMLLMAQASLLKGETEVAESYWRKVLEKHPDNMAAAASLTRELLKRGNYAQAEGISVKAAKANPADSAPIELLIYLRTAKQDWKGAELALQPLKANPKTVVIAKYWEARIAASKGKTSEAVQYYQDVLAVEPEHPLALNELKSLFESTEHRDQWVAYLQNLVQKHPGKLLIMDLLASEYITDRHWAEAEQLLLKATQLRPDGIKFQLRLIDVIERQSASRAQAALQALIAKQPAQLAYKFRLADLYAKQERYQDAEVLLQEIVGIDPASNDSMMAKLKMAELAGKRKDWAYSKTLLTEILQKDPLNTEALMRRASVMLALNDADSAVGDLQRLLDDQPNFVPAQLMLSQAYVRQSSLDKAENLWRAVLEKRPDNIEALQSLGAQLLIRKDWSQASELIANAIRMSPHNPRILELEIQLDMAKFDLVGAEKVVRKLEKLPSGEMPAKMWMSRIQMNQGNFDDAIRSIKEVSQAHPGREEVLMSLARAYLLKKDIAGAIEQYEQLTEKFPNNVEAANNLAELLATYRADNKAYIAKALTLVERFKDSSEVELMDTYGWVLLKSGDTNKALALLNKVIELSPKNASAHYHLAEAYRQKGDRHAAMTELRQSLSLAEQAGDDLVMENVKAVLSTLQ
ncbi:MAG: tetratricopeptide repeat protein [Gammaproteobacteria bacterium]